MYRHEKIFLISYHFLIQTNRLFSRKTQDVREGEKNK
ncbi:MAG: hypothetical protein RLZZ292_1025 [Bacteroidota bacterium]|jgi:hypothetical protein